MHIFALFVNGERSPSIVASYAECLEYVARLTDARDITCNNHTPPQLQHLGQGALERRLRLTRGGCDVELIEAHSAVTGEPMTFAIKLQASDAPNSFEPQVLQPLISMRLKDSQSCAIPHRTLKTVRGRRPKVLI